MLPIVPMGMAEWAWLAILLSVIGIIYASCIALMQSDFKRLIAFSSIAHVGLIAAGIFIVNTQGLQGAVMQMFSHGFNVLGLFLIADILYRQTGTMKLKDLGGLAHESRTFAVLFMIILLGSIALPLTNGFIGEFLLLVGIYQYDSWLAFAAGFTIILGAVYMLRSYKMIMLGDQKLNEGIRIKLQVPELIVLLLISAVVLGTGIFPQIILNVSEPDIAKLIETFITRTEAGF